LDRFLAAHPEFREQALSEVLPEGLLHRAKGGRLQLFPHLDEIDGFYIACMRKQA